MTHNLAEQSFANTVVPLIPIDECQEQTEQDIWANVTGSAPMEYLGAALCGSAVAPSPSSAGMHGHLLGGIIDTGPMPFPHNYYFYGGNVPNEKIDLLCHGEETFSLVPTPVETVEEVYLRQLKGASNLDLLNTIVLDLENHQFRSFDVRTQLVEQLLAVALELARVESHENEGVYSEGANSAARKAVSMLSVSQLEMVRPLIFESERSLLQSTILLSLMNLFSASKYMVEAGASFLADFQNLANSVVASVEESESQTAPDIDSQSKLVNTIKILALLDPGSTETAKLMDRIPGWMKTYIEST